MTPAQGSRVLLCADPGNGNEVRGFLAQAGYDVGVHALNGSDPADPGSAHLIVLEGSVAPEIAHSMCRRLRGRLGEVFVPIVFISSDASPRGRLASLECGADSYLLRPFE